MEIEKIDEFNAYFEKDMLEQDLMLMEDALKQNSDNKKEIVQKVFRQVHSLKGTAGMLKITPVVRFLHTYEDALGVLSKNIHVIEGVRDESIFDFFLSGVDILENLLSHLKENPEWILKEDRLFFPSYIEALMAAEYFTENKESYLLMGALDEDLF